ncbi:MAG TPA: YafY family protein [Candidatus Binataceae bacterium]|nr:YafY family protein [Candidatus Binataceae bacterium]
MRRADRLFEIIQRLRRNQVVTARSLADHFSVSERTIYRDIGDLIASKVPIEGAAGIGYSLRKGYDLPPLMFSAGELEALVFGARMVQSWSDPELGRSADAALAKIESVLPAHLRGIIEDKSLWAPVDVHRIQVTFDFAALRSAIHSRRKIRFKYQDEKGTETTRTVRPLTLWFYPPIWLAGSWCELRSDFRFFRLDRMVEVEFLDQIFDSEPGRSADDLFRQLLRKA